MAKTKLSAPMLEALQLVADSGGVIRAWQVKTNTSLALRNRGMLSGHVRLAGDDVQCLTPAGAEAVGTTVEALCEAAWDAAYEEATRRTVCPDAVCTRSFLGRNMDDARDRLEGHVSFSHLPASRDGNWGKNRGTQLSPERLAEVRAWLAKVADQDVDTWVDPEEGTGASFFAADGSLVEPETEEGWGQPEGMLSPVPQDRSADGVPEAGQEHYIPTAEERATTAAESALADLPPAPVCLNTQTHGPHRIAGTFRDHCPGYTEPITPVEQRTGISDVQAAVADIVADLREDVKTLAAHAEPKAPRTREHADMLLDRLAALVPQRATNRLGQPMWLHRPDRCGFVFAGDGWPSCSCGTPGGWQALYTVAGR